MARTSKAQQYAVRWLNSQQMAVDKIAEELSITEKQVQSILDKNTVTVETKEADSINTVQQPVGSRSQKLMIRETAGKKINNVAIMTGEASMLNDTMKNKDSQQRNTDNYIFRPNQ
jgi:predicted transcriptional regulator